RIPGYEVLEELAQGNASKVFRAWQTGCHRLVALKLLEGGQAARPAAVERFRREVQLLARLDHPHIVPAYDAGEPSGQLYSALKLLENGSLRLRLPALVRAPLRAAGLLVTLAEAVQHAHERGVIHCDLKPSNILFDGAGEPYVCDFCAAWSLEVGPDYSDKEGLFGTPAYMAPEQTSARGLPGPATDVYALGVILYEMLTGQLPFQGNSPAETIRLLRKAEPQPPRLLNPACPAPLE